MTEKWREHFPVREKSGNCEHIGKSQGILHKILEKSGNFIHFKFFSVIRILDNFYFKHFLERTGKMEKIREKSGKFCQSDDVGRLKNGILGTNIPCGLYDHNDCAGYHV